MSAIRLGVALYSFNAEYYTGTYSFEDCLAAVGSLGPGQGIELEGPQMIRGFPDLPADFAATFRSAIERHDVRPTSFGAYGDAQRFSGRYATAAEQRDYLRRQLSIAVALGFGVMRVHPSRVLADFVTEAEHAGVRLGVEVHAPMSIAAGAPIIEFVEEVDSPYLGLIPDAGLFCHAIAPACIEHARRRGVSPHVVDRLVGLWEERAAVGEIRAALAELDAGEDAEQLAMETVVFFGHNDPAALRDVMGRIVHVHAKFYGVDAAGRDVAARVPDMVAVLRDGGYSGEVSCEYEGHHWDADLSALEQIRALQTALGQQPLDTACR
jgi:sugar phosphate isomerase/epimerase